MADTTARPRQRRRSRTRARRPDPPMGVHQAVSTVGAFAAALAVEQADPFGRVCRDRIDTTLGPRRAAWRALQIHGPDAVRRALAAKRIFLI